MAALDFPTSPTVGQIYSANGKTFEWTGTSWVNKTVIPAVDQLARTLSTLALP